MVFNRSHQTLFTILGILFWGLLIGSPLQALGRGIAILPFRVSGESRTFPDMSEMPGLLQEATHFLIQESLNEESISPTRVRQQILREGWDPATMRIDEARARTLCRLLDTDLLLLGSVHFHGERIQVKQSNFSCRSFRIQSSGEDSDHINRLQLSLKRTILKALPTVPKKNSFRNLDRSKGDMAFLIDFSGSMTADRESILNGINELANRISGKRRMGGIVLTGGKGREVYRVVEHPEIHIKSLRKLRTTGEVDSRDLLGGLSDIGSFPSWKNKSDLILLTDAQIEPSMELPIENRLRKIQDSGMRIHVFHTYSQNQQTRNFWTRMGRILGIDPTVLYGRKMGFLNGESQAILQSGNEFYTAPIESLNLITKNNQPGSATILKTIQFDRNRLNLNVLPGELADLRKVKLVQLGPVVSGLQFRLENLEAGNQRRTGTRKVLVKQDGVSFWLDFDDRVNLDPLRNKIGKKVYLGLQFAPDRSGAEPIHNLPGQLVVKSQGEVPELFVNTRKYLMQVQPGSISPDEIWFLLVEIKDIEDAGKAGDLRE